MIFLVTNRRMAGAGMIDRIEEALAGGVSHIILREKDMEQEDLVFLAGEIRKISSSWGAKLLINSDPELAISVAERVGADGIHLPYAFYVNSLEKIEPLIKEKRIEVGVSVHSVEEVLHIKKRAEEARGFSFLPTYLLAGNIFQTQCKIGLPGKGLAFLKEVSVAGSPIPVVAIGGISKENIQMVMAHGAAGGAVMGAFMTGDDPRELAKELRRNQV